MTKNDSEQQDRKEAMKKLREIRKEKIVAATAMLKEQKKAIQAIKEVLRQGGKTVPQVAEGTGMPSAEVFWYLASLKKYGEILEGEKDGGYFQYVLAEEAGDETGG